MSSSNIDGGDSAAQEGPASTVDQPLGAISQVREVKDSSTSVGYTSALTSMGSIPSIFERWVKIDEILFDQTATATTIYFADPLRAWFQNSLVADKRANFEFFRGGLELYFVATIPPMTYGSAVITAIPVGGKVPSAGNRTHDPRVLLYNQCLSYDEAEILDYGASNDVTLRLPFLWYKDYINMADYVADTDENMYTIAYSTLAPLKSTTSDLTVTGRVTMYARPISGEIAVPSYQANKGRQMQRSDHVYSMGQSLVGATRNVPIISGIGRAVASGMDAAAGVMASLGFTREAEITPPQQVVFRPFANAMSHDVHDTSIVAAVSASNSINRSPAFAGGSDEDAASFASLLPRWTLIDVVSWNVADGPGTTLVSFPICPLATNRGDRGALRADYTVGGTVGLPFEFWRGGMSYYLVIPLSVRHRGKLQVSRSQIPVPSGTDITNVTFNHIFDVEANMCFKINVGYASNEPMLHNIPLPTFASTEAIDPLGLPYHNGYFSIQVVNSLEGPEASLDTQIFVFAACDKDMEFAALRNTVPAVDATGTGATVHQFQESVEFQAGAMGDAGCVDTEIDLVPVSTYDCVGTVSGEKIDSVRSLMQIPCQNQFTYSGAPTDAYNTLYVSHFQVGMFNTQRNSVEPRKTDLAVTFNFVGYYKNFFHGVAGSTRYKSVGACEVTTSTGTVLTSLADVYVSYALSYLQPGRYTFPSLVSPLFRTGNSFDGCEVVIPWYFNRRYELSCVNNEMTAPVTQLFDQRVDALQIFWKTHEPTLPGGSLYTCAISMFQSAGPDLRIGRYSRCPRIGISRSPVKAYPNPDGNFI